MNPNIPVSPGKRYREVDAKAPQESPPHKRPPAPSPLDIGPAYQAYQDIMRDIPEVYGAGPFAQYQPAIATGTISSKPSTSTPAKPSPKPVPAKASPSPPARAISPPVTHHRTTQSFHPLAAPVIRSLAALRGDACKFQSIALPLKVAGDTSIKYTPQACRWYEEGELFFCTTPDHPIAGTLQPFEEQTTFGSQFTTQMFSAVAAPSAQPVDISHLEELLDFVSSKVSRCIICAFNRQDPTHHVGSCASAEQLGTFVWSGAFSRENSSNLDQAIMVIAALCRIIYPRCMALIESSLNEPIPTDYLQYKAWCFEPATVFGFKLLKGYAVVEAIRNLVEEGQIILYSNDLSTVNAFRESADADA
ncbi:hypothetical protein TWF730_008886 [Orbilia blumenaviensis]|uniref:Uncharacterized protein n=1 Tax=Orbilia blumenaviensis TaxID=1796055 RepID=A0AAV9V3U0_9PEZI